VNAFKSKMQQKNNKVFICISNQKDLFPLNNLFTVGF